jgi:hypothetical protein
VVLAGQGLIMSPLGSPERPLYTKVKQDNDDATKMYMIIVDEGWRTYILCSEMYGWAADWLLHQLAHRPAIPTDRT